MPETLTPILVTAQELNHVLAALRLFQRKGAYADATPERLIATNDDDPSSPLMDSESIDALCERINTYDPPLDTFLALWLDSRPGEFVSAVRRAAERLEGERSGFVVQDPLHPVLFNARGLAHILAALRLFQRMCRSADAQREVRPYILDEGHDLMSDAEIEDLCGQMSIDPGTEQFLYEWLVDKSQPFVQNVRRVVQGLEGSAHDDATARLIETARRIYSSDEVNVDDDAVISEASGENGAWVQAWLWVERPDQDLLEEDDA